MTSVDCIARYCEAPQWRGWFLLGDVSESDADASMQISGRSKDVIKSGGEWISSIMLVTACERALESAAIFAACIVISATAAPAS